MLTGQVLGESDMAIYYTAGSNSHVEIQWLELLLHFLLFSLVYLAKKNEGIKHTKCSTFPG